MALLGLFQYLPSYDRAAGRAEEGSVRASGLMGQ